MTQQEEFNRRATERAHQAIARGEAIARSRGEKTLTPESLLAGILTTRGVGYHILTYIADPGPDSAERPEKNLRREFGGGDAHPAAAGPKRRPAKPAPAQPPLPHAGATARILTAATDEARNHGYYYVGTEHLVLSLLKHADKHLLEHLTAVRVTYPRFRRELINVCGDLST